MKNAILVIFILICTVFIITSPTISATPQRNSLNDSEVGLDFVPGELIVTLKSKGTLIQEKNFHSRLVQELSISTNSIKWESSKLHASLIKVKEGDEFKQMKLLKQNPNVESVELNRIHYLRGHVASSDPAYLSGMQWHLNSVNAPNSWQHTTGSPSIIVAVIDSGVDYTHNDLSSGIWSNDDSCIGGVDDDSNGKIDDCRGWDFVSDDNDPVDDNFHGTFVAGLIGARLNNINGTSMAPNVTLMPIKVTNNLGLGTLQDVIDGINYAVDNGADVINLSLGAYGTCIVPMQNAVNYANTNDVVFIVAAGETAGTDIDDSWPLCDNVISVMATDNFNKSTSYSDWVDTNDLASPGGDLTVGALQVASTTLGNGFTTSQGTSFATPHVSGCAALIKTLYPALDVDVVQSKMEESALDLTDSGYLPNLATIGKDKVFGWGLLQCDKAILKLYDPACTPSPTGDWVLTTSCTMQSNATILGDVIVQNNSILTIPAGITLDIDFLSNHLTVTSGSGVLIKSDGKIT